MTHKGEDLGLEFHLKLEAVVCNFSNRMVGWESETGECQEASGPDSLPYAAASKRSTHSHTHIYRYTYILSHTHTYIYTGKTYIYTQAHTHIYTHKHNT